MTILPEDRTETQVERTVIRNRLVREICLHEIRLAEAIANEDCRDNPTPADYYAAVCSTQDARRVIDGLYGEHR